jgi:hypothetical protein
MLLLKSKLHIYFNRLLLAQFNLQGMPLPPIMKLDEKKDETQGHSLSVFRFYTDSTGNNYPVVRQILKRRSWLVRVDKLKGGSHPFDQVHFFWTQWKKKNITETQQTHQIYGKIEGNQYLTNKSNLLNLMTDFYTSKGHNPYQYFPESFNVMT